MNAQNRRYGLLNSGLRGEMVPMEPKSYGEDKNEGRSQVRKVKAAHWLPSEWREAIILKC